MLFDYFLQHVHILSSSSIQGGLIIRQKLSNLNDKLSSQDAVANFLVFEISTF